MIDIGFGYPPGGAGAGLYLLATFVAYLGLPLLLVVISFWKRNIVAIIAAIISLALVAPMVASSIGTWLLAPIVVIIIGLGVILVRDAWGRGIEI